jgi:hypothetical protein
MQSQTIEREVRTYVYDLMNEAKEHGFKPEDQWTLNLVTEEEGIKIKRDYYPVVANKVSPEVLLQVFQSVKSELHQSLSKEELLMDTRSILNSDLNYIIAFNQKRHR